MPLKNVSAEDPALFSPDRRDAIVDVRSPSEFAEDHVPGALNLPVLDDAERAQVGAVYVRDSKFRARKIGASLVSANIARHLAGPLADKPRDWAPLVYCWRGGQRSGAMSAVLSEIGWRVETLTGGYRSYRRLVSQRLYERAPWFRLVLLDGFTGAGKTEILQRLAGLGAATLDLEDLAAHRGSLFGDAPDRRQPSQKAFESALHARLAAQAPPSTEGLGAAPLIFAEAESNLIGRRTIPPMLWRAMRAAPSIWIDAPLRERARYSVERYRDLADDPARSVERLALLAPLHGHAQVTAWRALAEAGEHQRLAEELIGRHYDVAYRRAQRRSGRRAGANVALEDLTARSLDAAALRILELSAGLPTPNLSVEPKDGTRSARAPIGGLAG